MDRFVVPLALAVALVFTGASATLAVQLVGNGAGDSTGCAAGSSSPSGDAKAILACMSPSVAFIETALGSGSGVLVEGRYVVTNAHVVDPFGAVDVVFEGGERHDAVPVKGVDLVADVAVIGPVPTSRRPLAFADPTALGLEKGDDLYLVGYPGEVDDVPDVTISRGILSRTRRSAEHKLNFLQTDAAIGGGQSGGALVDGDGQLVGVSGFSFAEEFALALVGPDVNRSVRRVLAGDAPAYRSFPEEGATSGSFSLADPDAVQLLTLRATGKVQKLRLSLPAQSQPALAVFDLWGDMIFANRAALDAAEDIFGPLDDSFQAGPAVAPGVWEFDVPKDTDALVLVGTQRAAGAEMTFSSNLALGRYDDKDQDRPIRPGQTLRGEIDSLETQGDSFIVALKAGQTIEVHASSAVGDIAYVVRAPGQKPQDALFVDDSGIGLFDTDAEEDYTAEVAGPHRITVVATDGLATGYLLRIREA